MKAKAVTESEKRYNEFINETDNDSDIDLSKTIEECKTTREEDVKTPVEDFSFFFEN